MNGYAPQPHFQYLRQVVDPSIAGLPTYALQARIDSELGEGMAESIEADLEGVFDGLGRTLSSVASDVGRFAQKAAPAVATVGGGVLQGAMAGSAAGLPGIIAGAAVGGVGAGLSRYGSGTAKSVGNAMSGITQMAGQLTPMGQVGGAVGSTLSGLGGAMGSGGGRPAMRGGPPQTPRMPQMTQMTQTPHMPQMPQMRSAAAAGLGGLAQAAAGLVSSPQAMGALSSIFGGGRAVDQFASMVQRPEFQQALGALRLGGLGANAIPVGAAQTPVPTSAFVQLLSHLAGQIEAEAGESSGESAESADLEFMQDSSGEFFGDPANVGDRSARLWAMLNEAQAERFTEALAAEWSAEDESEYDSGWDMIDSDQELYDQLDLAEADAIDAALSYPEVSDAW